MCDEGFQSSLAAATLQELGHAQATDLAGGFQAWRSGPAGGPSVGRSYVRWNIGVAAARGARPRHCDLLCLDLPKAEAVRAAMAPMEQLDAWSAAAKALGDPTRLAVALALRDGERACVCDLAWIVGRDEARLPSRPPAESRPARALRARRRMVMYELTARGRDLLAAVAAGEVRA